MGMRAGDNRPAGWLMNALAIVVLTIAIYSMNSDHRDAASSIPTTDPTGEYVPDEVQGLLNFVDSMTAHGGTARGHEFVAAGVRYVAVALGSVANSAGMNVDAQLDAIRELAKRIDRDPRPRERAVQARAAFVSFAALFKAVQQTRFRGLEPDVANVSRAALSFRAKTINVRLSVTSSPARARRPAVADMTGTRPTRSRRSPGRTPARLANEPGCTRPISTPAVAPPSWMPKLVCDSARPDVCVEIDKRVVRRDVARRIMRVCESAVASEPKTAGGSALSTGTPSISATISPGPNPA
jgi:hypothetical protein